MKKHTKIVALFLAVLMMLSLSACGKKLSVGDSLQMGKDGNGSSIWWEVIAVSSDSALVISRDSVDWKLFNERYENVTWKTSTLRSWLNNTFYSSTFNSSERSRILTIMVENPDDPDGGYGGNNCEDRLFLLSVDEVEKYYEREAFRTAGLSSKAASSAKEYNPGGFVNNLNSSWWTRTPGEDGVSFVCVNGDGDFETRPTGLASDLYTRGIVVADDKNGAGVRPAMWIKM